MSAASPRDLALHDLARAETGFAGVRLRAAAVAARPAGVIAAREIDDAEVWVMMPRDLEHRGHVGLECAGVRGGYQQRCDAKCDYERAE